MILIFCHCSDHICKVLNIDPETLPDHVTFEELGIESMFAVEIQSAIEQDFGVQLSIQEVKQLTVGNLKSGNFRELTKEVKEMKNYLQVINLTMPENSIEVLNSVSGGEPIFLLPGVMGVFGMMRMMAEKMHQPVIALNITREVSGEMANVKTAAQYYMNLLRNQYPNMKRYNLLASDFGALAAYKMAMKGFPCRIAVIEVNLGDRQLQPDEGDKVYDNLIEMLADVLLAGSVKSEQIISRTKDQILKPVRSEVTFDGKVKAIARELNKMQGGKVKTEEIEEVVASSMRRAEAVFEYQRKMAQKKTSNRFLETIAKSAGRFLLLKDKNTGGMLSTYLNNAVQVRFNLNLTLFICI